MCHFVTNLFNFSIQERIRNISDIPQLCNYYFENPNYESADALALKKKLKQPALGKSAPSTVKKMCL